MSEPARQLQSEYRTLLGGTAGKHLVRWLEEQVQTLQQQAYRKDPQSAWGDLQRAQGFQDTLDKLHLMKDIDDIGKLNKNRRSSMKPDA